VPSTLLGPPKRRVCDGLKWASSHPAQASVRLVLDPEPIAVPRPPRTRHGTDPLNLLTTALTPVSHRRYVVELRGARIAGRFGTVVLPDDGILVESLHSDLQYVGWDDVYYRCKLPALSDHAGNHVLLTALFADGYHEWLIYNLPRLVAYRAANLSDDCTYLVPARMAPWQWASLEVAGIPPSACVPFDDRHWRLERLMFATMASIRPARSTCEWLRGLAKTVVRGAQAQRARIYISRALANTRRVLNEAEVIGLLAKRGFTSYRLEDMRWLDQVRLFADAEIVVGAHGAGFTNCVFSQPGTRIIEFIEPSYVYPCFYWQALACDQEYWYLVGTTERGTIRDGRHGYDLTVNIDELSGVVDGLLEPRRG